MIRDFIGIRVNRDKKSGMVNITSSVNSRERCFFFQAEDGIRDLTVTGVQTCALPIFSFAIVQFLISNFVGPELTDIIAALVSMGCLALLLRFWRPKEVWQFAHETAVTAQIGRASCRERV